jgi:hypothetical protein
MYDVKNDEKVADMLDLNYIARTKVTSAEKAKCEAKNMPTASYYRYHEIEESGTKSKRIVGGRTPSGLCHEGFWCLFDLVNFTHTRGRRKCGRRDASISHEHPWCSTCKLQVETYGSSCETLASLRPHLLGPCVCIFPHQADTRSFGCKPPYVR